jgi:hypothetical protein
MALFGVSWALFALSASVPLSQINNSSEIFAASGQFSFPVSLCLLWFVYMLVEPFYKIVVV